MRPEAYDPLGWMIIGFIVAVYTCRDVDLWGGLCLPVRIY